MDWEIKKNNVHGNCRLWLQRHAATCRLHFSYRLPRQIASHSQPQNSAVIEPPVVANPDITLAKEFVVVEMSNPVKGKPEFANKKSWDDKAFSEYVRRVREEVVQRREKIPFWSTIEDSAMIPGGAEIWYGDGPYYLKLIGAPGTLAGDILRLKGDLPRYNCDLEIIGDDFHDTERKPIVFEELDPDLEDCTEEVAKLPLIAFDAKKHFTKSPTYKKEIRYLLQCQGSPHIVQLLGRTEEGALVFPKFERVFLITATCNTDQGRIQNIKRWMLDIIDGVAYLHSLGIVHRDLTWRNILGSGPLVICDLQCHNASGYLRAFELDGDNYSKFSFASDVFALGTLLWECSFYNGPHNRDVVLDNPPPPPFYDIFVACTQEKPEDRPTLAQLRAMYEAI